MCRITHGYIHFTGKWYCRVTKEAFYRINPDLKESVNG